jgi:stearoyl-CoA desaturase (delta-9 desaturase)
MSSISTPPTTGIPAGTDPPLPPYDGTSPFPSDEGPTPARDSGERIYVSVTAAIVVLPFVALGLVGWLL